MAASPLIWFSFAAKLFTSSSRPGNPKRRRGHCVPFLHLMLSLDIGFDLLENFLLQAGKTQTQAAGEDTKGNYDTGQGF